LFILVHSTPLAIVERYSSARMRVSAANPDYAKTKRVAGC